MWKCKKCEKPVYFAERIQSLGFDWHPPCLVCKECGKKLHPGQHAEHAAEPYCHHPCYGALFGPRLFGHGTRNECHGAFGKLNKVVDAERAQLESKVKEFNQVYDGKPGEITCREVNGRVVLEGIMRVHWAVDCLIHLKQEDETTDTAIGPVPVTGASGRAVGRTSVLLGTPSGVSRSRSNSSVNNSGPASDDSDDDEPLWRDDSPPATPRDDTPSTPSTPNPNWPPTPYPTLKPSAISSSPASKVAASGLRPSGSWSDIANGPQCSPVMSYTHNAPPHAPISHPLSSFDATEDRDDGSSVPMFINGNANEENVKTLCKQSQRDAEVEEDKWSQQTSSVLADDFEYGEGIDSRYATMKTRTVRRRKDIDKAVTQSMRDSLLFLDKGGAAVAGEGCTEPQSMLNESSSKDCNNASSLEANVTGDASRSSDVRRSDSLTDASNNYNGNNNINNNNGLTSTIKRVNSIQNNNNNNNTNSTSTGIVKRVSFSQVDWNEKLGGSSQHRSNNTNNTVEGEGFSLGPASGSTVVQASAEGSETAPGTPSLSGVADNGDDAKSSASEGRRTPTSRGKAVLRRRPGRRMDKKKVKRRCSINGHLYLRETSSFHLDPDCPPAVVRVTNLTTTAQLITTILEKYKIEMSSSNFALYVLKDNGEQRRLTLDEAPLTTRVMLGPHDSIAKIVLCDAKTTADITPEMAEFLHLSLAECRAILRQYEHEEQRQIRAVRARYDEMKFYIQYWLEQMDDKEKMSGRAAFAI